MEMIIPSVWIVLDCTINHLSLNLTATQWCQYQHAARNVEKPCSLRNTLAQKIGKTNHSFLACLSNPETQRLKPVLFSHSLVKSQQDFIALLVYQASLPPSVDATWNWLWCTVFPGLTLSWGFFSGSEFLLWNLMRALTIPSSFSGSIPFPWRWVPTPCNSWLPLLDKIIFLDRFFKQSAEVPFQPE